MWLRTDQSDCSLNHDITARVFKLDILQVEFIRTRPLDGTFKQSEFKKYLHDLPVCDAGTGLLFKFRPDTHGLNEEIGRH